MQVRCAAYCKVVRYTQCGVEAMSEEGGHAEWQAQRQLRVL